MESGRLVLVGAPLGNPGDLSPRAARLLAEADVVAAEDTRRFVRLAKDLGIRHGGRVVSYFDGNEPRRAAELVEQLRRGATVAVVTDGGMPSVSDPGYRLVRAAIEAQIPVTAIPGPSAVTTALAISGLPSDRFCFEGFLPRRTGERRARLAALREEQRTLVLFEAPHRLPATLADLAQAFGPDREAAVCRELTKTYEQVRRAPLGELAGWAGSEPPRGEITLVVGGAPGVAARLGTDQLRSAVETVEAGGTSRRDAIAQVARDHGLPRREVYNAVVTGQPPATRLKP
ncbi:MAG: 16S rRNA (cytidine(1402)-2'-O)-methyltransferase [Micromonosporaceae bacterium]|nr:16S rRNA (cytidine(1402)-2'-O)-methyltransferase [Micromonosporaceae bacterium]